MWCHHGWMPPAHPSTAPLRQRRATCLLEAGAAVLAVADVVAIQPAPTVVGDAIRRGPLDDLLEYAGQVLAVVRPAHTGDVQLAGAIRVALGIDREPVR